MPAIEFTAHDVETAVKQGLVQLSLLRAEVRIEILDEGSRGVLGIGARPARVRLTPYTEIEAAASARPVDEVAPDTMEPEPEVEVEVEPEPEPPSEPLFAPQPDMAPPPAAESEMASGDGLLQLAVELTQNVLDRMSFKVTCTGRIVQAPDGESAAIWVDIQGDDASVLLAHQMESLDSLQLIVQTMWAHQTKSGARLTLDVDSYKAQREHRVTQMAQRLAERVVSSGRSITLEPMSPSERRLVHLALRDHPAVMTESHGEGSARRVTIKLKK